MSRLVNTKCLAACLAALGFVIALPPFTLAAAPREPMLTKWGRELGDGPAWQEYPRPQLVRSNWQNLNGDWQLAIQPAIEERPTEFPTTIRVPFAIESELGGAKQRLQPHERAWYRRTFEIPDGWAGQRVLLHFGAVDWSAEVWVNGQRIGSHQGGYTPFQMDITSALKTGQPNELVVAVNDPTDSSFQPRGKQKLRPEGIWYTPVSGIWQTVWLEPVPAVSIDRLQITPNARDGSVEIGAMLSDVNSNATLEYEILQGDAVVQTARSAADDTATIRLPEPHKWSPADPFLYDLRVKLLVDGKPVDEVRSYFGLRSIELGPDVNGHTRILLNGEPVFQFGPLDQGYWPDGLYTAPSDEALRSDLETAKRLGFNMVRKHVKVEPARWYYWCDKLGLLVWQDMPNGDKHASWPEDGVQIDRSPASYQQFRQELSELVKFAYNSPSVVVWVPYNEGWGQSHTEQIAAEVKRLDPSRLVIAASGGNDFGVGDIKDDHFYPGPGGPPAERERAAVLGEFGGFGLPLAGHTWQDEANWGYRQFEDRKALQDAYVEALDRLVPLVESHVSAAVFTQLTDVEIEVNGLLTYDRAVLKLDEKVLKAAHARLQAALPVANRLIKLTAPTIAWWRFDDLPVDAPLPSIAERMGAIAVLDASGHNNHLYAFSSESAPSISALPAPVALGAIGGESTQCLDDRIPPVGSAPVRDLFTDPNLSSTHMDVLDRCAFKEWTIEASFCPESVDESQVVLAKQGQPTRNVEPPLQMGVFEPGGPFELRIIDGAGETRSVRGSAPIRAGEVVRVAATCDGEMLRLYLFDSKQDRFVLVDETKVNGALVQSSGVWIVGRGFDGVEIAHDFVGRLDEIRISTMARTPDEFLFSGKPATPGK